MNNFIVANVTLIERTKQRGGIQNEVYDPSDYEL